MVIVMTNLILIVEDDEMLRSVLAEEFIRNGFEVVEASNGAEALTILTSSNCKPIILSDIQMPFMDGLELLRQIGKLNLNIRHVYIMTAGALHEKDEALKLGATDFFDKTIGLTTIVKLISNSIK